ncbi:MAG: efflux transporter outer membrane subunit [Isosphaeraceae bacterium]
MKWHRLQAPKALAALRARRLRWSTLAFFVLPALYASGCIVTRPSQWLHNGLKVGPNYGEPPAPVAPDWIQARDPHVLDVQLPGGTWWDVFQDPVLVDLVHASYAQNPDLRAAGARVLEARASQAISVGNMFPQTQQAQGSYSRVNLSPNQPVINKLLQTPVGSTFPLAFSNWFYGFNLSWELDLWGRIRRNIESSNASLDASVEDYDASLVTLFADVATYYVQYRVAQQRIKIARDNVRIQEGVLAIAAEKLRVGTATRLDVEQARTVLEQTRSTIPAQEILMGQANDSLCILAGFPPRDLEAELGPGPELGHSPMPQTPLWVATGIPADLLRRRPDVRNAERSVAAQSAQIGVAEADLYPTIYINGTLGWDAADFSQAFSQRSFFGLLTPGFRWNILNYGRIKNNVHLQEAKTQELIATYQNQVLVAGRETQVALRGFLKSQERADDLAKSVDAAKAATEVGVAQYRAGTIDFNRVFNLETTLVQQQDQLASAQGDIALNLIAVYRAIGGGWQLRVQNEQHAEMTAGAPAAATSAPNPVPPDQAPGPAGAAPPRTPPTPGPGQLTPALPDRSQARAAGFDAS